MTFDNVLAMVLAGGEGTRLRPLTAHQSKPALRFAPGHRIVDFVLANLVNSQVRLIYLLAQYKPASLVEHIEAHWLSRQRIADCSIGVILPSSSASKVSFAGTADAVFRNLDLVTRHQPDVVAVFAADHIYRMDVRQMVQFHESQDADVTIAGVRVPIEKASAFGVMAVDDRGVVQCFEEKPASPRAIPGDSKHALASMGNYLFRPSVLVDLLEQMVLRTGYDFGRHVMPMLPASGRRVVAYDFAFNFVPGLRSCEQRGYWRDVGTLEALTEAQSDVQEPFPRLSLSNPQWPLNATAVRRVPSSSPSRTNVVLDFEMRDSADHSV